MKEVLPGVGRQTSALYPEKIDQAALLPPPNSDNRYI